MSQETQTEQRIRLTDLQPKQKIQGRVVRVELYGAFVDLGAEKDGLVHISQISPNKVNRVADVLQEGSAVTVWVKDVDVEQGRIGLTMIEPPERTFEELQPGAVLKGTVTKLAPYGAFVDIGVGRDGLIHISEMAEGRVDKASDVLQEGQEIEVRVVQVNRKKRQIELSLKGIGHEKVAPAEDVEAEPMTAMELAWHNAMESKGHSLSVATHHKGRRRGKGEIRRQQAEIIARTLSTRKE